MVAPWLAIALLALILLPARWGGFFGITLVSGESMEPAMVTGDVAFTLKRPSYAVGDVIVYHPTDIESNALVIHRVIEALPDGSYVTQGDNRETADEWLPTTADIDGGVIAVLPKCTLSICGALGWPFLVFSVLITVAVAIAVYELIRNGLWPTRVVLPDLPQFDEGDHAWDRSHPPPGLSPADVRTVSVLSAVLREEVVIYYEPSVSIRTGEVRAVEIHPRWQHAKHGLIKSNVFLPLSDERQLEGDIDFWVARAGLRQVAAWRQFALGGMVVFVRLPRIIGPSPVEIVDALLAEAARLDIRREEVVLGISPASFMADRDHKWRGLEALADLGVDLCLHHFGGAGTAPLEAVAASPVDYLTLDMSATPLPMDPDKSAVSRSVIRAANKGVLVIGREVKREEQLEALAEHGAVGFQGPLFVPPLPASTLSTLLFGVDGGSAFSDDARDWPAGVGQTEGRATHA